LEVAEELFEDYREAAAYHLHQAAEKSLKALQLKREGGYSYSHDVLALSDDSVRDRFGETFSELNPVYTGNRYPDQETGEFENLEHKLKAVEKV